MNVFKWIDRGAAVLWCLMGLSFLAMDLTQDRDPSFHYVDKGLIYLTAYRVWWHLSEERKES